MRKLMTLCLSGLLLAGCGSGEESPTTANNTSGVQPEQSTSDDRSTDGDKTTKTSKVTTETPKGMFPFEFSLSTPDGDVVALDDYDGKVRIVDIWGTWCPPCRMEVPHFIKLQENYGDEGLQIIGINYERDVPPSEAKEKIKKAVASMGINYPCVLANSDVLKQASVRAFPTTLFIDRAGRVREVHVGYADYKQLESYIQPLLAEEEQPQAARLDRAPLSLVASLMMPALLGQNESAKDEPKKKKRDTKNNKKNEKKKKDDKPKPPTFDELMQKASMTYRQGKYAEAATAAAAAAKLRPENPIPLQAQVVILSRQGDAAKGKEAAKAHLKAAQILRDLIKVSKAAGREVPGSFQGQILLNEARAHTRMEDLDKAENSLKAALKVGYEDFAALENDEVLAPVLKQEGFKEFLAEAKAAFLKKLKESLKEQFAATETFPFAFSLPEYGGKDEVSLNDYAGKVVIVDIWGTWCPPCRKEIPHFVDLQKKYNKKLQIIGVNYERTNDEEKAEEGVLKFKKQFNMDYPCLVGDDATKDQVPAFRGFPTTLFIDQDGVVRLKAVGYRNYTYLETAVELLLNKEAPAPKQPEPKEEPAEEDKQDAAKKAG